MSLYRTALSTAAMLAMANGAGTPACAQPSAALPQAAPCALIQSFTPSRAFAHEIDDSRTLAFVAYVETLDPATRETAISRAALPLPKTVTAEIARRSAEACDTTEIGYRTARIIYDLTLRWPDPASAGGVEQAVRDAVSTLVLGNRISPAARDAALDVFGTSADALDVFAVRNARPPSPAPNDGSFPPSTAPCDDTAARALDPRPPQYPETARSMHAQGTVVVNVFLDGFGFVRSVTPKKADVPGNAAGEALVEAAIVAAGATTYAPYYHRCSPVNGTYAFRVEFSD